MRVYHCTMVDHANIWNFILGCVFLLASAVLFAFGWALIGNLVSEFQDSPSRTYVTLGGLYMILAFGAGACGISLIRLATKRH